MNTKVAIKKNTYRDSVSLMAISTKANEIDGVEQAFVAMGTHMNKEVLRNLGLTTPVLDDATSGDLMIIVQVSNGHDADAAYDEVEALLRKKSPESGGRETTYKTIDSVTKHVPEANLAIIAVNGTYAAREARKALNRDLHVMLFSDNVSLDDEVSLKRLAHDKGLLMMGPDCGTAMINGIALGFGNAVRRGSIGIVGASGTGSQEVSVRVHAFGGGISQLIGTGGRDLTARVEGIMMVDGMRALDEDPSTKVIVLISKPPARAVEETVLAEVKNCDKPVVVCFIGGNPQAVAAAGGTFAKSTEEAALAAVELTGVKAEELALHPLNWQLIEEVRAKLNPRQRYIRGLFCGGTICDEVMYSAMEKYPNVYSNIHKKSEYHLDAHARSIDHTFLDFGDDAFTQGKPHPMIDPSTRIERFRQEAEDPEVGVIVMDFILGYGSHEDPVGVMIPAIVEAKERARAQGRHLEILGYVLGTDMDRPDIAEQVTQLVSADVTISSSSTNAGELAREFVWKDGAQ